MIIRSTSRTRIRKRAVGIAALSAGLALFASTLATTDVARAEPRQPDTSASTTSAEEAARVDAVPTPDLNWYDCNEFPGAECATAELPRDYDRPKGAKTEVAITRTPAKDQKNKIGSIFVNPGGPGGSATAMAADATSFFTPEVLKKFDIVGVDPRGTNFSEQVQCFPDAREQQPVLEKLGIGIPNTDREVKQYSKGAEQLGEACSDFGKTVAGSMSTAETARDMDVIRRAVGDKKLTYLGFSYGSYLGQVYGNLFPDRVRSLVIDGVLDPIGWAGTKETEDEPQTLRIKSGQGGDRALKELLSRCDEAGKKKCAFASEDSEKKFDTLVERAKQEPIHVDDPDLGTFDVTYQVLISTVLSGLYGSSGFDALMSDLQVVWNASAPTAKSSLLPRPTGSLTKEQVAATKDRLATNTPKPSGFPYNNYTEAFTAVLCTDSVNPSKVGAWDEAIDNIDPAAKYFGPSWGWASAPCADSTWTVEDEDAYRGPFTATTSGPVLVVGNYWDPATNYRGAETAAGLLPNSGLLLSDNWGHTAYGTSACATRAVSDALLDAELPAKGTRCVGDDKPFDIGSPTPSKQRTEEATGVDPDKVEDILRGDPGHF